MTYEFSLDKDVEDLDGDEAREALSAFMEKYDEEAQQFEELDSKVSELEGEVEEAEARAEAFETADSTLAEEVAEVTRFTEEEALQGLDFDRKLEIVLEEQETQFEEVDETPSENEGEDVEPEFEENGSELAGLDFSEDEVSEADERASDNLKNAGLF